ncbi:MAG: methyltransferase [Neomegalonema sp.]|nr:methyltransferase [Neomegalonema sp.]
MSEGAVSVDTLTDDAFLGGKVRIWQPREGYRAATDPVLLAAACIVAPGDRVLDVGCGVGTAALCLAARAPWVRVEGIEAQAAFADISERNAARAGVPWRVHRADLREPPLELRTISFDHVLTNPPFYDATKNPAMDHPLRAAAHREQATLGQWLDFCLRRLRPKGRLTLIHRCERLPEIMAALEGRAGDVAVLPLQPRPGRDTKRVIVRARKEARGPFRLAAPLTLHPVGGEGFTDLAKAILRDGAALDF